jgi:hypothetical protein
MMGRTMIVLVVAMATTAFAGQGPTLVLCAKAKGGVVKQGAPLKLRTACTAKEVAVDPDAVGLRGPAGAPGQNGTDGTDGTNGTDGTDGAPGLSGLEVVTADGPTHISGVMLSSATASCPGGKSVIGGGVGGVQVGGGSFNQGGVLESFPITTSSPQGWFGSMLAQSSDDWKARVFAICANASP